MKKLNIKKNGVFFVMLILFITKIFGFFKLRIIAQLFGVSHELDIFWAAFTIPDMLFNILVAGSINAAIIPIFSEIFYKKGKDRLDKFFNYLLIIISIVIISLAVLLFIFTPHITNLIIKSETLQSVLNFSERITNPDFELFVKLTRIMLLSPILLSISSLITAYLQIEKEFFTTSLAPLFYNIAMTIGPVITIALLKMGVDGIAREYNNQSSIVLKKYKYKGVFNMSEKLSSMLTDVIYANNFQKYLSNSILLPVPSSKQRLNERGFNQVDLIAESISKNFNLVYDNTILYRKFQIGHQALRDRQERLVSVDNSFYIKDYSILKSFKTITIVDDVITTGKTLENIRNLFPTEYSLQALCLFRGKPFYSSFGSSFLTKSRSSVDICL